MIASICKLNPIDRRESTIQSLHGAEVLINESLVEGLKRPPVAPLPMWPLHQKDRIPDSVEASHSKKNSTLSALWMVDVRLLSPEIDAIF